jgi:hypothetical protein
VDGAGEVASREPRGSDELELGMIEQLPTFTPPTRQNESIQHNKVIYCKLVSSTSQNNLGDTKMAEGLPLKACGYQDNKFKECHIKRCIAKAA